MSDGRSELENAIEVWEQRHAAAVRAKREAEVVMPFLRAAVEELDSFHANAPVAAPVETPVAAAMPPASEPGAAEASPFSVGFASSLDEAVDTAVSDEPAEAPTEFPHSFQRRAISSLMDEDEGDAEAASR